MKKLSVTKKDSGQRLDLWLVAKLKLSRNNLQNTIKKNLVTINGKAAIAHRVLKEGDEVVISEAKKSTEIKESFEKIITDLPVIAETEDYVVINKPAGLLMHGTEHEARMSLVDWLIKRYPKIAKVGEDPARPGIVHRLDKDVSGLVVIAKNQNSFDDLKKQFQKRTITKKYIALVYDAVIPEEAVINFKLDRSSKGYRMAARPQNQEGKTAVTNFVVEKRFHNYTLLDVTIKTGRTHQIRAHLAAYNHPVVGDDLYGTVRHKLLNKKLKLGRIFLIAAELSFTDLKGERQTFSLPIPKELKKVLETIA